MSASSKRNLGRHRRSLRRALLQAVTPEDISEIMKLQVFLAKKGDPIAVREVLDRTLGRPGSVPGVVEIQQPNAAEMTSLVPADDEARLMDSTVPPLLPREGETQRDAG